MPIIYWHRAESSLVKMGGWGELYYFKFFYTLKRLRAIPALVAATGSAIFAPISVHAEEVKSATPEPAAPLVQSPEAAPTKPAIKTTGWMGELPIKSGVRNKDCDLFGNPRSQACVGASPAVKPANLFERAVMGGTMLGATDGKAIISDPYTYFQSKGTAWAISQATAAMNKQFQKIPFLAQTTVGMDQTTGASGSFYLDSLMKITTLGKDAQGDPKGLMFGQARWTAAWGFPGSTINTGVGTRYRIGKDAMVGVNGFWDYRMVEYTSAYSRWGVGVEGFYKDFELRNNWYISGTDTKVIGETASTITYERVVPGWDVELGYRLPSYPQLAFFLKGFGWDYVSTTDNTGIGGYVNWQATPNVNLEAGVSNEVPVYLTYVPSSNNDVYVNFKLKYTFNKVEFAKRDYKSINLTRMTQPVRRRYDVLLERYTSNKNTGTGSLVVSGI
jgi:adhesin/invasin